jgi:hypothetical protein
MTRARVSTWLSASVLATVFLTGSLSASDATILSIAAPRDSGLTADPDSPFWKSVRGTLSNQDSMGNLVTKNVMTIRSRWTRANLYLLFTCGFESLYLKRDPQIDAETNGLWKWDVAEAFIGDDFENINRYKEFEVSPQGEWVDLDIDRGKAGGTPDGWRWNSGFKVKARIDDSKKVWFAEMCIPFDSISRKRAEPGLRLRINFFRTQGEAPNRTLLAWQPTHASTFHVPAVFGIIQLVPLAPGN